jgi:hypothetical protein
MTVTGYRPTRLFKDKLKEVTWIFYQTDAESSERLFLKKVLKV